MVRHSKQRFFDMLAQYVWTDIAGMKQIGSFVELHHGVAGDVFALDEETIVIKNFVYDGQVLYRKWQHP